LQLVRKDDAKQRRNARIVAGVDQIHRARQPLAEGQCVDGGAEFSGIRGVQLAGKRLAGSMRDVAFGFPSSRFHRIEVG
jgi:hypothetical protein